MCVYLSKGEIENYIAFILQTIKSEIDKVFLAVGDMQRYLLSYSEQENEKLMFCLSDEGYGLNSTGHMLLLCLIGAFY